MKGPKQNKRTVPRSSPPVQPLDSIDRRILSALRADGRLTGTGDPELQLELLAPDLSRLARAFGVSADGFPDLSARGTLTNVAGGDDLRLTGLLGDDLLTLDARLAGGLTSPKIERVELSD